MILFLAAILTAQGAVPPQQVEEDDHLRAVLSETNGSPVEVIRAFELHLKKFPNSRQKADIEKAIVKSAIEVKDDRRVVEYGERVLEREADLQILDRVAGVLIASSRQTNSTAERALKYAKQFEELVLQLEKEALPVARDAARRRDEVNRGIARSLVMQSFALSFLKKHDAAVDAGKRAFDRSPSESSANALGNALEKAGKHEEAARAFADAFMIPDSRATEAEREGDRRRMAENWKKAKGSEVGLAELLLPAYDRSAALVAAKRKELRELDPNRDVSAPMEYVLSGLNGDKLSLKTLLGKVVVMDFWATWCGPCRGQYPLYEEVKKKYKNRDDVVFLGINTDEERSVVKPFLEAQKWTKSVYFEDGLSRLLRVENIPATLIFDRQGRIFSRMNGYVPERFVEMLTTRIDEALESGIAGTTGKK